MRARISRTSNSRKYFIIFLISLLPINRTNFIYSKLRLLINFINFSVIARKKSLAYPITKFFIEPSQFSRKKIINCSTHTLIAQSHISCSVQNRSNLHYKFLITDRAQVARTVQSPCQNFNRAVPICVANF